jgi:hypothetical protein
LGQIHATYILQDHHQPDWLGYQQTSDAAWILAAFAADRWQLARNKRINMHDL